MDAELTPSEILPFAGPERRKSERVACERYALVFPLEDATPDRFQRACITSRSDTGVAITCVHELPVGTRFILRYDEGRPEPKLYTVVQTRIAGGACLIGAALIRSLAPLSSAA
jgi:hypothetical protein